MKRKLLNVFAIILALSVMLQGIAFAAVPNEVKGTTYGVAITKLYNKGIITGDTDGNYHPDSTLTRVQACILIVNAMRPCPTELQNSADRAKFNDMNGYGWAADYIGYAVKHGIVAGYPGGSFKAGNNITMNELIAMNLRAAGYKDEDLHGTWPTKYTRKADALNLLTGIEIAFSDYASKGATAQLIYNSLSKIEAVNPVTTNVAAPPVIPSTPSLPSAPITATPETTPAAPPTSATPPLSANAYYVSTAGNDSNAGTAQAPLRTIQKAADLAAAGDTVYIKGGTYREKVLTKNSGANGSYITFTNYPGESVTLDGSGVALDYYVPLFSVGNQSYIKIQGINVINSAGQGFGDANGTVNNGYIIIKDCSTYKTQISGVHFFKAHNIVIDGVYIDTANLTKDQESVTLAGVTDFEIKNSTVVNPQKEGIDVKDGSRNGKIYNNTVKNARLGSGLALYVDGAKNGCSNIEIYNNTIDNSLQGIVIASELGGAVSNINIHDNKISNSGYGLQIAGWGFINGGTHPMDNITINRNNVSGNMNIDLILSNPDAKSIVITNNIFGGTSRTVPVLVQDTNINEISMSGNSFIRLVTGQLTGTDYTLL